MLSQRASRKRHEQTSWHGKLIRRFFCWRYPIPHSRSLDKTADETGHKSDMRRPRRKHQGNPYFPLPASRFPLFKIHRSIPVLLLSFGASATFADTAGGNWPHYGGDAAGQRYSPLAEITIDNVDELEIAWTLRTGDLGEGFRSQRQMAFEATPILHDGVLFISTPRGIVIAIDAGDGTERWRFDPQIDNTHGYSEATSRGVASWVDPAVPPDEACRHRIIYGTLDARLIALDGRTGKPCLGFGDGGAVAMSDGMRVTDSGDYLVTSPPVVVDGIVITGSAIGDNRGVELEHGTVRGYNAHTGELIWGWNPIPQDESDPFFAEWGAVAAGRTGAANAWAPLSVDEDHGIVYVPTGAPSPDYYGGERPGNNHYANSLVALDAATGSILWHRQLVHHDVWDYDLPAQPTLVEFEHEGSTVAGVVQPTKMGMLFVFDRVTGEPVFPIEERPVPQSGVAGEFLSPTQPFPAAPPPLVRQGPVTPDDAYGFTFWDRGRCREKIEQLRSDGIYTPPSFEGTIVYPSYAGGSNWGGIAFDRERQLIIANTMQIAHVVALVPRDQLLPMYESGEYPDSQFARQRGTPYGMRREMLMSPFGAPCTQPPWGTLAAVDLRKGTIKWQVPLGTLEDVVPFFIPKKTIGVPNIGGPIVTAGGLIFIGATTDNYLRAFNVSTGKELWRGRLPAGGQATPMTYQHNGKQFVVIAAGGHGNAGTDQGDYVIAFTLPN